MDHRVAPWIISERARQLTSSAIREILKVTERSDIISFAGGLPSPAGFPVSVISAAMTRVLERDGRVALQYGPTEGFRGLREWVAADLNRHGAAVTAEQVLILAGSQQGLDLIGKVLIDPHSKVLVETPSYLGALQSFSLYQPQFESVPADEEGLLPDSLRGDLGTGARLLYALPNFQNPTGRTLSLERRVALLEAAAAQGIPLIEDDPYGELRYAGTALPGLLALSQGTGARVIRLGSFSKVLAPGMRLGYLVADPDLIGKFAQAKQATDLHTGMLIQMAVHEVVSSGFLDEHLPGLRNLYRDQCAVMLEALEQFCPKSVRWTRPEGGMFLWLTLPSHMDSQAVLDEAIREAKVAFVPGAPFYASNPARNTLRLSFVTVPADKIRAGIERLAAVFARHGA